MKSFSVCFCVRLCFCQLMFPSACVPASLRLRPPVPLPVCVLASLYPVSLHPQHCSASSLISPIFIQLIRFCLFFSLVLFFPYFPYLIFSFLFFLFFSSSLIFSLPIPILLTLLVLPATHPFWLRTLYREQISGHWAAFPSATHLFLSKNLYREHTLRNCDVPLAATHPFELKTLYREQIPGH